MSKLIAVVPAYNEGTVIRFVVEDLRRVVSEVVVVDDGSTDQTNERAREAGAMVLRHFLNRGQGAALQTGISFALTQQPDVIITYDADGQFSSDDVPALVAPIIEGRVDVVLGSRFLAPQQLPVARALFLRLAAAVTRWYTGLKITDTHNGLRAFSFAAAAALDLHQDRMAHASEILEQISLQKFRHGEVPVRVSYSEYSLGKGQRLTGSFRILWDLFMSRISR